MVHAVLVRGSKFTNKTSGTSVDFATFRTAVGPFLKEASKSDSPFTIAGDEICLWGAPDLVAMLKARAEASGAADPLPPGTIIRVSTAGSSLLIQNIEVVKTGTGKAGGKVLESGVNLLQTLAKDYDKPAAVKDGDDWED
jgi:hypothetical protein